jgi:hypothetical protein
MPSTMKLASRVLIRRTPEQVGAFLADIGNISKWDRGVSGAAATNAIAPGEGFEFDTYSHMSGHDGQTDPGRMSYRVISTERDRCTVELISRDGNARYFKRAYWHFSIAPDPNGTVLVCVAEFQLRWQYFLLAPLLRTKRSALTVDLEFLRKAIEGG